MALRPYAFDTGCGTIDRSIHVGESALRLLVRRNVHSLSGQLSGASDAESAGSFATVVSGTA